MPKVLLPHKKENLGSISTRNMVVLEHFPGYFLIACLLVGLVSFYFLFQPFLTILVLAATLVTAFYPLYKHILAFFRNHSRVAALTMCILVFVVIVIPLIFFLLLLARQATDIYIFISNKIGSGEFDQYLRWQKGNLIYDLFDPIKAQLASFVDLSAVDVKKDLTELAKTVSSFLLSQTANFVKGAGLLVGDFLVMFFAMYYFFKDGKAITTYLMKISPLPLAHDLELFRKFKEMSKLTLYSVFLVSIFKGILGGVGFLLVGIPNPVFWGTAMAIFSLLPIVGPTIIWFPAAVLLLLNGQIFQGIFLLLYGTLIVSTIDNFFQAFFVGNKAKLNPLLVFLAVFGGIGLFGLNGVIFGPLILTLFMTFLHIYQLEYRRVLKK